MGLTRFPRYPCQEGGEWADPLSGPATCRFLRGGEAPEEAFFPGTADPSGIALREGHGLRRAPITNGLDTHTDCRRLPGHRARLPLRTRSRSESLAKTASRMLEG